LEKALEGVDTFEGQQRKANRAPPGERVSLYNWSSETKLGGGGRITSGRPTMNREAERAFHSIQNVTGRRYPALMKLLTEHADVAVAQDLFALARDLTQAVTAAARRGAREPWRVG
jgi:hypothetical protein